MARFVQTIKVGMKEKQNSKFQKLTLKSKSFFEIFHKFYNYESSEFNPYVFWELYYKLLTTF